ncbi:MAG: SPOR domain-containing protein [Gemmatimonadales bacterium]
MISRAVLCGAILVLGSGVAQSQGTTGQNPVYRRAQTMVNDGNAAAGRALIDSMISVAAPGSNDYAEAIYWRAVLAATAADAEMDYRRIVVDYPSSPRVEDALIRLAQMEMARANYDGALRHLNRLAVEHPQSPARGRAGYWTARVLFDKNDIQGGCAAIVDALARTSETDTELRNQINYLNQRCAGVVLAGPTPTPSPVTPAPTVIPLSPPVRDTGVAVTVAAVPPAARPPVDSVKAAPVKPAPVAKTPPSIVKDAEPAATVVPPPGPSTGNLWSVQVAAYNVKSQADAMVAKLKKSGYQARVDGTSAPFRVRIGKYGTQAQASAVQRSLKAKQITGFVVQADIR